MERLRALGTDAGLLCLRVLMGLGIAWHGSGKIFGGKMERFAEGVDALGFPLPALFAWAAALSEFLGGLLVAAGLGTRISSFFILVTMLVAAFLRHGGEGFAAMEKALLFATIAAALILAGPGRFSVDARIRPWVERRLLPGSTTS